MKLHRLLTAGLLMLPGIAMADFITAGRPVNPDKSFSLRATVGKVSDISGGVTETTRRLFELEGRDPSTFDPESYTFEELGIEDSDMTFGLAMEKNWKYFTFRADLSYMRASASGVPPRDFFIGVSDIKYKGKSYEYMKLEDGIPYDASIDAALFDFRLEYTPFTLAEEYTISFTPIIHLGMFGLAGTFEVDQGEPQRIQIYENPPREYVVGGHGEGTVGGVIPEIGIGGEFRFWFGENNYGARELAVQGSYGFLKYKGSSDALGISSRNEKDLDIDCDKIELRATFYLPISEATDFLIGAEYKAISTDASSKSKAENLEEAQKNREKWDKDITFDLTIVNVFAGLRF